MSGCYLELNHHMEGDVAVINMKGDFDGYSCNEFKHFVDKLLTEGHTHFVVVLDELRFMDSMAADTMVQRLMDLAPPVGSLKLVCTIPTIRKAFDVMGLNETFNLYPSVEKAIKAPMNDNPIVHTK